MHIEVNPLVVQTVEIAVHLSEARLALVSLGRRSVVLGIIILVLEVEGGGGRVPKPVTLL